MISQSVKLRSKYPSSMGGFTLVETLVAIALATLTGFFVFQGLLFPRQQVVRLTLKGQLEVALQEKVVAMRPALLPEGGDLTSRVRLLNGSSFEYDPTLGYDIGSDSNFAAVFNRPKSETLTVGGKQFQVQYAATMKKYGANLTPVSITLGSDHLSSLAFIHLTASAQESVPSSPPVSGFAEVILGL